MCRGLEVDRFGITAGDFLIKRRKKLVGQHFCGRFDHSLTYSGNYPANLHFAFIRNRSSAIALCQIENSRAFYETGRPFAIDSHAIVSRRLHVFETHVSFKGAFDRTYSGFHRGDVGVLFRFFEGLTARNAALEDLRISDRVIDDVARGFNLVGAFNLHTIGSRSVSTGTAGALVRSL